jgi:hypothetical protein
LGDPKHDQRQLVPRQGTRKGADDEDDEAGLVHAYPTEHVPEPADLGRDEGDDQQVADDDPDDRGQSDVEGALDLGQGQDDDRGVDRRDENADHHYQRSQVRVIRRIPRSTL